MTDVAGELSESRFITEHDIYPLIFEASLKSTNKRRLMVLKLALQPVCATIEVEDNVGFLTASRRIL